MKPCNIVNKNNLNAQLERKAAVVGSRLGVTSEVIIQEDNTKVKFTPSLKGFKVAATDAAFKVWKTLDNKWPGSIPKPITLEDSSSGFEVPMTDEQFDKMIEAENSDPLLFQLEPLQRTQRNERLETVLKQILVNNKIELVELDDYKVEYEKRTGQKLDVLGLADIAARTIAWSQNKADGKTLPEEVGHFLESMLKTSDENNWKKLMNGRDSKNILHIQNTKVWKQEYNRYLEKYGGDTILAKREIIGKLMGDFIANKFEQQEVESSSPIIKYIIRAIDKIKAIFSRKDINTLPREISEIFEGEVTQFFDGRIIETSENIVLAGGIDVTNRPKQIADQAVEVLNNRIKQIKIESNRLKGDLRKRYKTLKSRHNIDALFDSIKLIEDKSVKTEEDLKNLIELNELVKLDFVNKKEIRDIETLNNLNKQLFKLERLMKNKQESLALKYFISGVPKKGGKTTEGGLRNDLINVLKDKNKIENGELELSPDLFSEMTDFVNYYTPIIDNIKGFQNLKGKFEDIPNKKFRKEIKKLSNDLDLVKDFLRDNRRNQTISFLEKANTDSNGNKINPNFDAEHATRDNTYYDINYFTRFLGAAQHVANPLVQAYINLVSDIQHRVYERTRSKGTEILAQVQALKKKLNIKDPEKTLMERDSQGKATGYHINKYILGGENGFLATKERDHEKILDQVELFAKKKGVDILLPRGKENYNRRKSIFLGEDILGSDLNTNEKRAEIQKMKEIRKKYNELKGAWNFKNTKPIHSEGSKQKLQNLLSPVEFNKLQQKEKIANQRREDGLPSTFSWTAELIIHHRSQEMSKLEFQEWTKNNIRESFGQLMYTGELITPSDKYLNKKYQTLSQNKDWKEFRDVYFSALKSANNQLPKHYSNNYASRFLMPQISKSGLDVLVSKKSYFGDFGQFRKDLSDLFTSGFTLKEDDDIYATDYNVVKGDSSIYRNAPIRYNKLLKDPSLLSEDVFSSLIAYIEMSENFVETNSALKTVDFIRTSVEETSLNHRTAKGVVSREGADSLTLSFLKDLIATQIYGEVSNPAVIKIGDKEFDLTKFSNKFADWIRKTNLLGNFPAVITGLLQAVGKETFIEHRIGLHTNVESSRFARKEVLKNAASIVSEFNNPVKTNKLNIFIDKIGLQSNRDRFDNLDKSRIFRASTRIAHYGLWAAADFIPKSEAFVAVADNYRLVEGEWMTKNQFEGTNEEWKALRDKSFYNMLEVKGNDISNPLIGEEQWATVRKKALRLASNLDTQPMDIDRGTINRKFWAQFITLHRSWMFQGLQRRFKPGHFNYITQENELGYYRGAWSTFKTVIGNRQILTDLKGTINRWQSLSLVEKEGAKRTLLDFTALYAVYLLAYIMNGLAADDDDNPLMQLAAYISTRLVLENLAFLSASEFIDTVNRPVAGLDFVERISGVMDSTVELFNVWDETEDKIISRGPYKDMTHLQRDIIKSIPWIRGIYETFPLDTPLTNSAVAIKSKNRYVKNQVFDTSPLQAVGPLQAIIGPLKDAGKD